MKKVLIYILIVLAVIIVPIATIKPVRAFVVETTEVIFGRIMNKTLDDHVNNPKYDWAKYMRVIDGGDTESPKYKEAQKQIEANFEDINSEILEELEKM